MNENSISSNLQHCFPTFMIHTHKRELHQAKVDGRFLLAREHTPFGAVLALKQSDAQRWDSRSLVIHRWLETLIVHKGTKNNRQGSILQRREEKHNLKQTDTVKSACGVRSGKSGGTKHKIYSRPSKPLPPSLPPAHATRVSEKRGSHSIPLTTSWRGTAQSMSMGFLECALPDLIPT
mgnify:CR=1 FL=1